MSPTGSKKGRFIREIVMIASFAMLVVLVSAGLYADPAKPSSLGMMERDFEIRLTSVFPPAPRQN